MNAQLAYFIGAVACGLGMLGGCGICAWADIDQNIPGAVIGVVVMVAAAVGGFLCCGKAIHP